MESEQEYCAACDAPVFPPETFLDSDGVCNLCATPDLQPFYLFYTDGGAGGPYKGLHAAETAARAYVRSMARNGRRVSVDVRRSTTDPATETVSRVDLKACILTAAIDGDIGTVRELLAVLS